MNWWIETEEVTPYVILYLFLGMAFLQLFWTFFFHARVAFHRHYQRRNTPPVSIIIAARNEEDNLFKNLPTILEQNYPKFEVIVVNHQSSDYSVQLLKAFSRTHKHLRIVEIEKNKHLKHGKKLPLTVGIKGAQHEHLLFTDADCIPASKNWLADMAGCFSTKHEIVLGYGPYQKKKGFLNKVIRFDTFFIALSYFSFAKGGLPYMGVGRNLGYTKSIFMDNNGFKSHYAIQSGDDDLFIQEVAKNRNYTVCLKPDSFCYSQPEKNWADWVKQKSRHYTTTERYQVIKKIMLGIYPLSLILLYISFLTLFFYNELNFVALISFGVVVISKWFVQGRALFLLKEKKFVYCLPLWDLFYTILSPIIYYSTEKSTEVKWK